MNLSYTEAVDLLISIAVAEQMQSPIFLANLGSIRRQLVASFAPDKRNRVERIKCRVLIGTTASTAVQGTITPSGNQVIQTLHQSFLDQNTMTIHYRDEGGKTTTREIEAHYLLLNYPVWYVLAFDHLRAAPRTFRCDRIVAAEACTTRFQVLPKETFRQTLGGDGLENLKAALG